MIADDIKQLLDNPDAPVTRQWVDEAQRDYPYFTLPLLLFLKRDGTRGNEQLLDRLAIATPDRLALAAQLGNATRLLARFNKPRPTAGSDTEGTIDRFLDAFGNTSSKEIEAINNAIFNPTPDYADILAQQERDEQAAGSVLAPAMSHDDQLINDFIEQSRQQEQQAAPLPQPHVEAQEKAEIAHTPISEPAAPDGGMLSESLAKMYISRHKYSKALEIIENINLKFPEKSIYFADQIRFLRKLVKIENSKKTIN